MNGSLAIRLALALAVLALCLPAPARAEDPPIPISEYWALVEATRAAVADLAAADQEVAAARLAALTQPWQQITRVALYDGAVVAVDHSALTRTLLADPPDLARVQGMLEALLASRDRWPAASHISADLRSLEAILARPEFQAQGRPPSPLQAWWESLLDRIERALARLLPNGEGVAEAARLLSVLLNLAGLLAFAALMAYVVNQLVVNLASEARLRTVGDDGAAPLTAEAAFQRAQALAEGQDYRSAVRYLYLSALLTLDERGLLHYDRSKTNREYLGSVAGQPALAATLREVIEVFDRVWYGFQPLDAAGYARYAAQVAELRRP